VSRLAVLITERVEHDHLQQGAVDKEGEMAYETKPAGVFKSGSSAAMCRTSGPDAALEVGCVTGRDQMT